MESKAPRTIAFFIFLVDVLFAVLRAEATTCPSNSQDVGDLLHKEISKISTNSPSPPVRPPSPGTNPSPPPNPGGGNTPFPGSPVPPIAETPNPGGTRAPLPSTPPRRVPNPPVLSGGGGPSYPPGDPRNPVIPSKRPRDSGIKLPVVRNPNIIPPRAGANNPRPGTLPTRRKPSNSGKTPIVAKKKKGNKKHQPMSGFRPSNSRRPIFGDVEKIDDKRPASIPSNYLLKSLLKKMPEVHEYGVWQKQGKLPWKASKNGIAKDNNWDQELHTYRSDSGQIVKTSLSYSKGKARVIKVFFQEHDKAKKVVKVFKVGENDEIIPISPLKYRSLKSSTSCMDCHSR